MHRSDQAAWDLTTRIEIHPSEWLMLTDALNVSAVHEPAVTSLCSRTALDAFLAHYWPNLELSERTAQPPASGLNQRAIECLQCPVAASLAEELEQARTAQLPENVLLEIAEHPNAQFNVAACKLGDPTIRQIIEQRFGFGIKGHQPRTTDYKQLLADLSDIKDEEPEFARDIISRAQAALRELLDIAHDVSTMDCFYSGSFCAPDCECLSARASRAIDTLS